jgi:hypothetical protein
MIIFLFIIFGRNTIKKPKCKRDKNLTNHPKQ